jgi:catechol 2,3-dioxygenase-like lactoylglutathione lyase family enzyme
MLYDVTLGTNDLARAVRFYSAVFEALGQPRRIDAAEGWAGWGATYDKGVSVWLCPTFDGRPATPGNGSMLSLKADSAAQVRAAYAAGLHHGGSDEGAPGIRARYSPDFYVAYLRDPDGHKLALVFPTYDPSADV